MEMYDFSGYATRNDLLCGDGRTIRRDAFKDNDGQTVPLVWNHQHNDSKNVLGHALLENREDGVYAYCTFNDTERGQEMKKAVRNGDVKSLSIYANKLKQVGNDVVHGAIRELSIVLAGANPGAFIDFIMAHEEGGEDSLIAGYDENIAILVHAEQNTSEKEDKKVAEENTKPTTTEEKSEDEETIADVYNAMTDKQKSVVQYMVGKALEDKGEDDEDNDNDSKGGNEMKHNVFEADTQDQEDVIMHSEILDNALADAKRFGSLRESVLQHAAINNITDIGELFPQEKDLNIPPEWIKEDDSWVAKVMNTVHHTPFSRVRALFAKMDEQEARARGYIKGKEKANLKLAILKRTTQPTTVYIKTAMDRDDVVDINDFDVLAWQRAEMRKLLDRELAVAMLLGDGREPGTDDKISEECIRPVLKDVDTYTIQYTVTDGVDYNNPTNSHSDNDSVHKGIVRAAIKARKEYKGSGTPTFFTTEDTLTELLLVEDQNGHRLYKTIGELATAMRVKEIVTVPEMEAHTGIYGIIVNMADYNTGADKGGAVSMFDDFDIDYNQMKYLMETRMSGALVKPYSAIVLKKEPAAG